MHSTQGLSFHIYQLRSPETVDGHSIRFTPMESQVFLLFLFQGFLLDYSEDFREATEGPQLITSKHWGDLVEHAHPFPSMNEEPKLRQVRQLPCTLHRRQLRGSQREQMLFLPQTHLWVPRDAQYHPETCQCRQADRQTTVNSRLGGWAQCNKNT